LNPSESEITAWLNGNSRQALRNGKTTKAIIRRRLQATPPDVWNACTDRDALRLWFGEVKGELSPGATVKFDFEIPHLVASEIKVCIPRERLLISWRYEGHAETYIDEVELRLEPAGAAADMLLEHRSEHGTDPAGVGPGWESWLFRLTELLRGVERPEFSEALEAGAVRIWNEISA
jgi:uncharacterized protein YndB with AHSA1/START domain